MESNQIKALRKAIKAIDRAIEANVELHAARRELREELDQLTPVESPKGRDNGNEP